MGISVFNDKDIGCLRKPMNSFAAILIYFFDSIICLIDGVLVSLRLH